MPASSEAGRDEATPGKDWVSTRRSSGKVRRAVSAEDGHSVGEQCLYQALWSTAEPESADTRLIRIGYGGMRKLCGLDKSNCKKHVLTLLQKLSVEIVGPFNIRRSEGNTYRVFSSAAIFARRHGAGLDWVIRRRSVQLVNSPTAGSTDTDQS
jgi:hypothetical protein